MRKATDGDSAPNPNLNLSNISQNCGTMLPQRQLLTNRRVMWIERTPRHHLAHHSNAFHLLCAAHKKKHHKQTSAR